MKLLETLHGARPNHRLVAADFDSLPGVTLPGRNAPLVAAQARGGKTRDLPTYLAEVGNADVFFPTDSPRPRRFGRGGEANGVEERCRRAARRARAR